MDVWVKFLRQGQEAKKILMIIWMECFLEIINEAIDGAAKEATEEYDCTDMTQGVSKVFFFAFRLMVV